MPETEPLTPDDPTAVGPYRLSGRLGMGGQGVVYLGHGADGVPVAVKVLRAELAAEPRVRERFTKEIAAARRVDPFCIAQVLDASLDDRRPYIVTEYVEGPSLQQALQQAGPRDGAALRRLAVATATALAAIHEAGVVHRDFKPSNVLLGPDGPRVIDFGIARDVESPLTVTSSIIGTPAYMAPEQFAGDPAGPPADVFAWGSVIACASTGRPPFGADTFPAIMHRVLQGEPDLGDMPEPLRATVTACLAKDPARRPAMQAVLLRLLGAQTQATGPADARTVVDPPRPAPALAPAPAPAQAFAAPAARPAAAPMPGAPHTVGDGGRKGRASAGRRPVVLLGAGAAALVVALLAGAAVWTFWPDASGAEERDQAGYTGTNPQGRTGPGGVDATGGGATTGPSGSPSPSGTASTPGRGKGGSSGPSKPGSGSGSGSGSGGGNSGGGSDGGSGGSGGGGSGSGGGTSGPTARIDYFTVGTGAACEPSPVDLRYRITGSRNPTPIKFSIYFDGRLGDGHPISWAAEPSFSSGGAQSESKGTHSYRMVLISPSHQEITRTFKVC
ncbi:serine/threonine protein kinase [Actinomadura madurae]|uniref:serine/threonine-protein kinase n=1 Tax=Actinomadura madurae TaxID=1993 RepID=UPI00399A4546